MVSVKPDDHWAFLEEIEAPTWADLTLEANPRNNSISSDEWFKSSHISEKLKALERESVVPSSPKLPSSVSRSRGKDFKSKNWAGQVGNLRFENQHQVNLLTGISPIFNSSSARRLKPKSSFINPARISSSKSSLTSESSVAMNIKSDRSNKSSTIQDSKSGFSSSAKKRESRTCSTITAESKMHQVMGRSLWNSRLTIQPTRVETTNFRRESSSSKSSRSKTSSVGSSSNPGYDVKSAAFMSNIHQKRDVEIRNVRRMTCAAKNKVKSVNTITTPAILVEAKNLKSRVISKSLQVKTGGKQESVKPTTVQVKTLSQQRVVVTGKENINGGIFSKQKVNDKKTSVGRGIVAARNAPKKDVTQRGTISGVVKPKGKLSDGIEIKPKNGIGRVYFR